VVPRFTGHRNALHQAMTVLLLSVAGRNGVCDPRSTAGFTHPWEGAPASRPSRIGAADNYTSGAVSGDVSTTGGESRVLGWTAVNETERRNRLWRKRLQPEVARHHRVRNGLRVRIPASQPTGR